MLLEGNLFLIENILGEKEQKIEKAATKTGRWSIDEQ